MHQHAVFTWWLAKSVRKDWRDKRNGAYIGFNYTRIAFLGKRGGLQKKATRGVAVSETG
jgi:hypothetical protein